MNIKRAIGFGVLFYLSLFFVYGILTFTIDTPFIVNGRMSLAAYIINWILMVPIVLILAKWYFRKAKIGLRYGMYLGIVALCTALVIDGVAYVITSMLGISTDMFVNLYTDWKLYVIMVELFLLSTLAGAEFDGTFTRRNK